MSMCCAGALKMPKNYVVMDEEEMIYVEGGSYSLKMTDWYLKKYICNQTAEGLLKSGKVTGMSKLQIAQEIYAHAVAYYNFSSLLGGTIGYYIALGIKNDANPIDIEDGGDKRFGFMNAYTWIWNNR